MENAFLGDNKTFRGFFFGWGVGFGVGLVGGLGFWVSKLSGAVCVAYSIGRTFG